MSRSSDRQPKPYGADVVREMISFRTHLADNIIKPVSEPPIVCPTTALLQIKNKKEAGRCITQDEWARLTHFVFLGAEYPSARSISRESVIGILQAFKDAYAVNHHVGDNAHFAGRADNLADPPVITFPRLSMHFSLTLRKVRPALERGFYTFSCAMRLSRIVMNSPKRSFHTGTFFGG